MWRRRRASVEGIASGYGVVVGSGREERVGDRGVRGWGYEDGEEGEGRVKEAPSCHRGTLLGVGKGVGEGDGEGGRGWR